MCQVLCCYSVAQRVKELAQGHTGRVAEQGFGFRSLEREDSLWEGKLLNAKVLHCRPVIG